MKKLMLGAAVAAAAIGASAESVYNLSLTVKTVELNSVGGYVKPATIKLTGLKVNNEYIVWTRSGNTAEILNSGLMDRTTLAEVGQLRSMADWAFNGWTLQGVGATKSLSGYFTGIGGFGEVQYGSWSAKENKTVEKKLAEGKSLTEAYKFPNGIKDEVEAMLADKTDFEHLINNASTLADYAAIAKSAKEIAEPAFVAASNDLAAAYLTWSNSTASVDTELAELEKAYDAATDAYDHFPNWKPEGSKKEDLYYSEATNALVDATEKAARFKLQNDSDILWYALMTQRVAAAVIELKKDSKLYPQHEEKNNALIAATNKWIVSAKCPEYAALTNSTKNLNTMVAATNNLQATTNSIGKAYATHMALLHGYAKSYFESKSADWQKQPQNQYLDKNGKILADDTNFRTYYREGYQAKRRLVDAGKVTKQWDIAAELKKGDVILTGQFYMTVDQFKSGKQTLPYEADDDFRAVEATYIFEKGEYLQAVDAATAAAKNLKAATTLAEQVQLKQDAVAKGADEAKAVEEVANIGWVSEKEKEAKRGKGFSGSLYTYVNPTLFYYADTNPYFSGDTLLVIEKIAAE